MDRRTFVELSSLGILLGESIACGAEQTAPHDANASIDTKPLPEEDVEHLRLAIQLSDLSSTREYGENHPFGAVIVLKNRTVIKGHNHVHLDKDPTQHAEVYTVSQACRGGLEASDFEGDAVHEHRAVRHVLWRHLLGRDSSRGVCL